MFSTRFECVLTCFPLVSSVFFSDGQFTQIHGNEVCVGDIVVINVGDMLCADGLLLEGETTLETSGEDVALHSKRVEKITRNECARP